MFKPKNLKNFIIVACLIVAIFVIGDFAYAQNANNLFFGGTQGTVGNILGLGSGDPRIIAASIIRVLLGFLGILAVGLIMYAGFIWMTADGEADKIEKARKILIGAVIGLVIILSSFAIASFILSKLYQATGAGGGPCNTGDSRNCGCGGVQICNAGTWGPCVGSFCGPGANAFYPKANSPTSPPIVTVPRNTVARYWFSQNVGVVSNGNFPVTGSVTGAISSIYNVNNALVEITPDSLLFPCPTNPCGATSCFPAGETITVDAQAGNIFSQTGNPLQCGLFGSAPCQVQFVISNAVDCQKPTVGLISSNQACINTPNALGSNSSDDSGVVKIDFSDDNASQAFGGAPVAIPCGMPGGLCGILPANWPLPLGTAVWNPTSANYNKGQPYTITATAYDIDSNAASDNKTFTLRAAHCCNGQLDLSGDPDLLAGDSPETGLDCGGADCTACSGAACGVNLNAAPACAPPGPDANCDDNQCASGFCNCGTYAAPYCENKGYPTGVTDCCICENAPIIDWVTPVGGFCSISNNTPCQVNSDCPGSETCDMTTPNGAEGNYVTIGGRFFGAVQGINGTVEFDDGTTKINAVLANCATSWQDDQIIVEMPSTSALPKLNFGVPIKITVTADNGFFDSTFSIDGRGPVLQFVANTIQRPGICSINPSSEAMNNPITYAGIRLTGATARFGDASNFVNALTSNFPAPTSGTAIVPNLQTGKTTTFAAGNQSGININSNYLRFTKKPEPITGPIITSFSPIKGKTGQYVTIYGTGFGAAKASQLGATHKVWFDDKTDGNADPASGSDEQQGTWNFPLICADGLWTDKQIIVKVPDLISIKNPGDYYIAIDINGTVIDSTGILPTAKVSPTFNYDSTLPLAPSLCKISPIMGPNLTSVSLWGEYFGPQGTGSVNFQLNQIVAGGSVALWDNASTANQIAGAVVPLTAVSGPAQVVQGALMGNGINFNVGNCAQDSDCGSAPPNICCPSGTFKEFLCADDSSANGGDNSGQIDIADCYYNGGSSVYEWDFSTTINIAPLTCAGYTSANACLAANSCPNSPGQCQTSANIIVGKGCGDAYCNSAYSQCDGNCAYDLGLNKCKKTGFVCDQASVSVLPGYTAQCRQVGNVGVWQINVNGASCPNGSYLDANGWCTVGAIGSPSACNLCANGFSCLNNECVVNSQICPANSTCDLGQKECVKNNDICECCCQSSQDCCLGLTCAPGGCGSGPPYGLCAGCAVYINLILDQTASDAACNCAGTTGKYCDLTINPLGVCLDTVGPGSFCSDGGACSVGASCAPNLFCDPNKNCTCQLQGGPGAPCDSNINTPACDPLDTMCAAGLTCDVNTCKCKLTGAPVGTSCEISPNPLQCVIPPFCIQGLQCSTETPLTACGNCCCDITNDQCDLINPVLKCRYDTGSGGACDDTTQNSAPATPDFGLCCGCSTDTQCGMPNFTGCGLDTCCRARPKITSFTPAAGATNICRNAMISATFDQKMDIASFSGNVIVVGDYGANLCPKGTQYLVREDMEGNKGFMARIISKVIGALKKIFNPILPRAWAQATNYCAITGTVSGYHNTNQATTLTFSPKNILDSSTTYYVIIKGDGDTSDSMHDGVKNIYGVPMDGPVIAPPFNAVTYYGTNWSFKTMSDQMANSGICKIDRVEIDPVSYLFQTTNNDQNEDDANPSAASFDTTKDKDKVFIAKALTIDGQQLAEVAGVYEWTWAWTSSVPAVADIKATVFPTDNDKQFIEAQNGVTDGKSIVTATANVSGTSAAPGGEIYSGQANVWVFVCENPWPAIDLATGYWEPWSDSRLVCSDGSGLCRSGVAVGTSCGTGAGTCAQNCLPGPGACYDFSQEFYYCRDAGGAGTADDLPAILNDAIIRGSSTVDNLLKEYYFFREKTPGGTGIGLSVINKTTDSRDGKVDVSWSSVSGADGYKIYYGKTSGNYSNFIKIPASTIPPYVIKNLTVDETYYFAITTYNNKGAESGYLIEASVLIEDITPPAPPQNLILNSACAGDADISWSANTDDAIGYRVYYGVSSGVYGGSQDVKSATGVTLTGLADGNTYYITVRAYDIFGNESGGSTELTVLIASTCP